MKIAFIGNFEADFSTENYHKQTFESLGHEVITFQKINNSSAESLKKVSEVIKKDLKNAEKGYFCQYYQRELIEAPNIFNL